MKTIKLSHSILKSWSEGRHEEAVAYYLGKDLPTTPAMELGKTYDEIWNNYIEVNQARPTELGGGKLVNAKSQIKYRKTIPFSDDYQILISGVPDLTYLKNGELVIDEHKCGRTDANQYLDSYQLDYYKLLLPNAVKGIYRCFNPYFKSLTIGVKYLTDKSAERALEHIITYGGEMIEYLEANKLIIDFKENK